MVLVCQFYVASFKAFPFVDEGINHGYFNSAGRLAASKILPGCILSGIGWEAHV